MTTATFNATKARQIALSIKEKLQERLRKRVDTYLQERADKINKGFFHRLFRRPLVTPENVRKAEEYFPPGYPNKFFWVSTSFSEELDTADQILRAVEAGATSIEVDGSFVKWYDGN